MFKSPPVGRYVHLACLAFCLWRLVLIEHLKAGWLQVASARESLSEASLSFQRVRRALRAWATRQVIFTNATPGADVTKIGSSPSLRPSSKADHTRLKCAFAYCVHFADHTPCAG
jgi:hypothetical protein